MAALVLASAASAPARLTVNGSRLIDPAGSPVRLTGFNWQSGRTGDDPGALQKKLAPGANMARLVGVLWGNTHPLQHHPNKECMTNEPPNYFNDKCFNDLDPWVQSATDAGLWVVLAVRGEYIAGQLYDSEPGTVVFRNETLRNMMFAMWRHVAARYASFDRIAAYEILSEPRDKAIGADVVRSFYEDGCAAVQSVDARTPCMVGNAPYYKLWTFGESMLLRNNRQVIYTFDYFEASAFVFGTGSAASLDSVADGPQRDLALTGGPPIPQYNASYPCATLYDGWVSQVCPSWNVSDDTPIPFDARWHAHNLETYATPLRQRHDVPLFLNQFEVVHGVSAASGRYGYIRDLLALAQRLDIGWAWWTWAGGNDQGWSHGSAEIVFRWPNGSTMVDTPVLDAMAPYHGAAPSRK